MGVSKGVKKFIKELTGSPEEKLKALMEFQAKLGKMNDETATFIQEKISQLEEADDS